MDGWSVICRPLGENKDGENTAGLAVLLVNARDTDFEQEVARVAFVRKFARSGQKKKTFDEVLNEYLDIAQQAADVLNDADDGYDSAVAAALVESRSRIAELFTPAAGLS